MIRKQYNRIPHPALNTKRERDIFNWQFHNRPSIKPANELVERIENVFLSVSSAEENLMRILFSDFVLSHK